MATPRFFNFLFLSLAAVHISGCSLGKTYAEIDPEGAKEDVRRHNGYYALKTITPGTAKIVYRSEGSGHPVDFLSTTASTDPCASMKPLGSTADVGRGVVYPWIANMTAGMSHQKPFLSEEVKTPGKTQVQARAAILERTQYATIVGHCGFISAQFHTQPDHAYVVRFVFEKSICRLAVDDATNPDAPIPVAFQPATVCGN